jgi:hypothetical protein
MVQQHLRLAVEKLMLENRRFFDSYTYTVPSPEHYPFQWLWDSCFHAIILSHIDINLARQELRSLLSHPLANGLVPHIIYWKKGYETLKWGREYEGDVLTKAWGTDGVSSITQPPLIASALWEIHMRAPDISFLNEVYPAIRAHYLCLLTERNFSAHGLMGIINPDESGEDNSPRFDSLQGLPSRHSPRQNLHRRIDRVREHAQCGFDVQNCTRLHFWIEDVSFNAVSLRALEALSLIAQEIGARQDSDVFSLCAQQIRTSMQLHMKSGYRYYSLQGETQESIIVDTWGLFMPLYAGLLHKDEATLLIKRHLLNSKQFFTDFPIPSVSCEEASFTRDDLWRGPTWIAINWFVHKGLKLYGFDDVAETIRQKTINLLRQSGFREYYDTHTGIGYGAHNFTWGGLMLDMD